MLQCYHADDAVKKTYEDMIHRLKARIGSAVSELLFSDGTRVDAGDFAEDSNWKKDEDDTPVTGTKN